MAKIYKKFSNWILITAISVLFIAVIQKTTSSNEMNYKETVSYSQPNKEMSFSKNNVTDTTLVMATQVDAKLQTIIDEYTEYLEKRFKETHSVGAAVAIVYKGQVILIKPFGVKDINTHDSVNINTVFRLASVSKGFAGVLASKLHNEHIININEKIVNYINNFELKKVSSTYELSLAHTLSHTTGLVPHAFDDLIEINKPLNLILDELKKVNIACLFGKLYGYQNVAFSLIDTVLKVKTGKSYNQHLKEKIFEPLGMNSASVSFDALELNYNVAAPHKLIGRQYKRLPDNDKYYSVSPAAGVNASIADMSKWLIALTGHRPDIIDSTSLEMIAEQRARTPLKSRTWRGARKNYYGLGWRIVQFKHREVLYHGGFVNGYKAEIAFSVKDDIGIAFLTNSPNSMAPESIPAFLEKYFAYRDAPKHDLLAIK
ncbi:MAG: beta-lactamase family protein [Bacteroidales bacterium]|nr:beta-lactamase family protein [Bacteroidales bacterium]